MISDTYAVPHVGEECGKPKTKRIKSYENIVDDVLLLLIHLVACGF